MKNANYFSSNLRRLAEEYSQKKIAEDTKVSPASINNYINKDSEPSIYFLMALKKAYGINIDDFLFKPLSGATKAIERNEANDRFIGNYMIYHYDTSAYKGRVSNFAKNTLSYGVLSVFEDDEEGLVVKSLFFTNRREAEKLLNKLNTYEFKQDLINFYTEQEKHKYEGHLVYSNTQIFMYLVNYDKNDRSLMIFNNPPSTKEYIGGIGTVNSVSRGREHMPCIQFILISRNILSIPDGEIYNLLALDDPDINLEVETNELIKLFKNLYSDNEFANSLSEDNKKLLIKDSITNMMADSLEANAFRYSKISSIDDDKYYRVIKRK